MNQECEKGSDTGASLVEASGKMGAEHGPKVGTGRMTKRPGGVMDGSGRRSGVRVIPVEPKGMADREGVRGGSLRNDGAEAGDRLTATPDFHAEPARPFGC